MTTTQLENEPFTLHSGENNHKWATKALIGLVLLLIVTGAGIAYASPYIMKAEAYDALPALQKAQLKEYVAIKKVSLDGAFAFAKAKGLQIEGIQDAKATEVPQVPQVPQDTEVASLGVGKPINRPS
jgi:hypothetical protein